MRLSTKQALDYFFGGLLLTLLYPAVRLLAVLLRRNHALLPAKEISVIKLLGAGSLYLALPALQAIREKNPDTRLSLVCSPAVRDLASISGLFDKIHVIDDRGALRLLTSSLKTLLALHRDTDCLIDLEVHSRLSTVFSVLSTVRNRVGFYDEVSFWRRRLYTHCLYFNIFSGVYEFYDGLAALFGADTIDLAKFRKSFAEKLVATGEPPLPQRFVAVGAGCSELGQERQLSVEFWVELLKQVQKRAPELKWVFLGGKADRAVADLICAKASNGLNLCGQYPLQSSLSILSRAEGFVGIDSLLLHISRSLLPKVASFWGPTAPETRLRRHPIQEHVSYGKISCSPCIHVSEAPPCHGENLCMRDHAIEPVLRLFDSSGSANENHVRSGRSGIWVANPENPKTQRLDVTWTF